MIHHFDQRCQERGISSIPGKTLRQNIERAIAEGRDDLVELVFHIDTACSAWRFRVAEGVFYAICGRYSKRCITLYNREIMRGVRNARRFRSKITGKRKREIP